MCLTTVNKRGEKYAEPEDKFEAFVSKADFSFFN